MPLLGEIVDNPEVIRTPDNGRRHAIGMPDMGAKCINHARRAAPAALALWLCALLLAALGPGILSAQTGAARVIVADGSVSVMRQGVEWALFAGNEVAVGELVVTGEDGYARLEVADGSSFTVYPNSQVVFRTNPGSFKDLLDLFLGRIKVHIQRLGGAVGRERIFTPTAVISVRGTVFDVSVDENETTIVSVDEGLVAVQHRLLPGNEQIPVEAGQSLTIYRDTPLAKAGVDKSRAVAVAEDIARSLAYIWNRLGRRGRGTGGGPLPGDTGAGGGPPLPGDTSAPEPPPPPED